MSGPIMERYKQFLPALGILAVCGLTVFFYRHGLAGFFVQDDFGWLTESRFDSVGEYLRCFFRFNNALVYRPLSQETFFLLGQKLFGLNPLGFHAASMLAHLAGVCGLFFLLRRFAGILPSLAAALFYGIHTAHFRSVCWISAFPEPLALVFYLLAVALFVRFDHEGRKPLLGLSFLAMLLGIMSKESILSLPLVLAAYCLLFSIRRLLWTAPFFVVAGGYAVARFLSRTVEASPYRLVFGQEAWKNSQSYLSWAAGFTEGLLKLKLHWPEETTYPIASVLFVVVMVVILFALKKRKTAVFGALWFLIALQPVLYFSQHIYTYYLAPALAGLSLFLAAALDDIAGRKKWAAAFAGLLLMGFSLWTAKAAISREARWWNERSFVSREILEKMPEVDRQVPNDKRAFLFGFGEYEYGAMQNDAALKAFDFPPTRFLMIGLDKETPDQIRVLKKNTGINDFYCFVYSKGDFAHWTERFRDDPEGFILLRPEDYLEDLYQREHARSPVRFEQVADSAASRSAGVRFRLSRLDAPAIDLLYMVDGRLMPAERGLRIDSDGSVEFQIAPGMPRGWYHFRAIRDSRTTGLEGWIPINTGISIR